MNGLYILEENIIYCKIGCTIQSAETHVDKKMQASLSTQKKKASKKAIDVAKFKTRAEI